MNLLITALKPCIRFLIVSVLCIANTHAQTPYAGFMYGEITMVDDKKYAGVIQWNNGELCWDDIFTATKQENKVLQYLSADEIKRLSEEEKAGNIDWGFIKLWEKRYPYKNLTFECQFGYIRAITITGDESAKVTLKDGKTVDVFGENNTGKKIYVLDKQGRRSKLEWEKIQSIVFENTPENVFHPSVSHLYGTVISDFGEITGFIQWDMDESLNVHYLDGKQEGNKKAIPFSEISQIEKKDENTCRITLASGENMDLSDTDDVGESNHGIMVKNKQMGNIKVDWNDFQKIAFTRNIPPVASYDTYKKPMQLSGKVKTIDKKTWQGTLIYDLDESMDIELLKGRSEDLLYYIPFSDIKSIQRKNYKYTAIILKNGNKLVLTDSDDVTDKNWGILVLSGSNKPQYIPWNKIDYITFNK